MIRKTDIHLRLSIDNINLAKAKNLNLSKILDEYLTIFLKINYKNLENKDKIKAKLKEKEQERQEIEIELQHLAKELRQIEVAERKKIEEIAQKEDEYNEMIRKGIIERVDV